MEIIIVILTTIILGEITYLIVNNKQKISKKSKMEPIFVDTSVLIDGRIIAVAQSGFISEELNIPRSVIGELQLLADGSDSDKRSRARHGLDVVAELQKIACVKVKIFQDDSHASEGVDERLLKLAKRYHGSICTIDYNLNKVAQVEQIKVLNVNDLAMSLRMAYLPGEKATIQLVQKGQESAQAVGYLADGTMVVVEKASNKLGQSVTVGFTRSLQTAAGKMMFAKIVDEKKTDNTRKRQNNTQSRRSTTQRTTKKRRLSKSAKQEQDLIQLVNNQK